MDNEKTDLVIHTFEKVMNGYLATEKRPRDYGLGFLLYRSEIHTIDAIGRQDQINVTLLAHILGVTKSAASQMIDRLVKKGLVVKTVLSKSDTEVSITLTSKGETVFQGHQKYHNIFYSYINEALCNLPEKDIDIFIEILEKLIEVIDQ